MFGWIFILVGNSAANCISFGVHVLAAAGNTSPHTGSVQAIALGVAWIVFLVHASGRMFGIRLNSIFASVKVAMLCMIIILGFVVLNDHTGSMYRDKKSYLNLDVNDSFQDIGPRSMNHARGYSSAYLDIIFTFGGFNQANYVSLIASLRGTLTNMPLRRYSVKSEDRPLGSNSHL